LLEINNDHYFFSFHFLQAVVTTLGAILNCDDCHKTVVCNACNDAKSIVQVGMVLADHYLPPDIKNGNVAK
jgi:hypothetical protein